MGNDARYLRGSWASCIRWIKSAISELLRKRSGIVHQWVNQSKQIYIDSAMSRKRSHTISAIMYVALARLCETVRSSVYF